MVDQEHKHELKKDADLSDMIGPALMLTSLAEWRRQLPHRGFESKEVFDAYKARVARVDEAIHALGELMLKSVEDKYVGKEAGERRWRVVIEQFDDGSSHYINVRADDREEAEDKAYKRLAELVGRYCDKGHIGFKTVLCEEVE